jgi:hypothetical protein
MGVDVSPFFSAVAISGSATDLTTGTLPNARLSAVPNSALANSSITIAGHSVSLGGSQTLAAADLTNGTTGSGSVVLATSPTIPSPTFSTAYASRDLTHPVDQGGLLRWKAIHGTSVFQGIDAGGIELSMNLASAGDFSSSRVLLSIIDNYDHTGSVLNQPPPVGINIGSDGDFRVNTNHWTIYSDNGLHSASAQGHLTTSGGVVTAVFLDTPGGGGYSVAPIVKAIEPGGGSGTGCVIQSSINGSGNLTGITLVSGGSGYGPSSNVILWIQASPTDQLDQGPQLDLVRNVPAPPYSYLGILNFEGQSTSGVVDTIYACITGQVVDPTLGVQHGRLSFQTGGPFVTNAGNNPRCFVGLGFYSVGAIGGDPGQDYINFKGYQIDGMDIFSGTHSWSATQKFIKVISGNTSYGIELSLNGTVGQITGLNTLETTFNPLQIATSGSPTMYFDTNNRVGINKTSLSYAFDVAGDVNINSGNVYRVNGAQIAASNLSDGNTGTGTLVHATNPTFGGNVNLSTGGSIVTNANDASFQSARHLYLRSANGGQYIILDDIGQLGTNLVYPKTDNTTSLGTSGNRWTVVYATTGTINTSDSGDKLLRPEPIDERELRAVGKVRAVAYQMRDAIDLKGADAARWHYGYTAQDWVEAYGSEGLDPWRFGAFCKDLDTPIEIDGDGDIVSVEPREHLALRYDQCLALKICYLEHENEKLQLRITTLESKLLGHQ